MAFLLFLAFLPNGNLEIKDRAMVGAGGTVRDGVAVNGDNFIL